MNEIIPGVYHWVSQHEGIGQGVSSYYLTHGGDAVVIDPREPDEGLKWFDDMPVPSAVILTNRHHYRHSDRLSDAWACGVLCQQEALQEFSPEQNVQGFEFGERLPLDIEAVEIGALNAEETALYIPWAHAVAFADALVRGGEQGPLSFLPDFLMGDDPAAVKSGLVAGFRRLLERDFDNILFAHGIPIVGGGKAALQRFVDEVAAAL